MIIRSPKLQDNFYILDKTISEDERLTWAARGLLIYLLGKPDNWEVSVAHLQLQTLKSSKPTKRDGIYGLLKELIETGYVNRVAANDNGRFGSVNYIVSESPVNPPLTPLPDTALPYTAETPLIRTEVKQVLKKQTSTEKDNALPKNKSKKPFILPEWIDKEIWSQWMQVRKDKRQSNTDIALNDLVNELMVCQKAGFEPSEAMTTAVKKSWAGLKLNWLINLQNDDAQKNLNSATNRNSGFSKQPQERPKYVYQARGDVNNNVIESTGNIINE